MEKIKNYIKSIHLDLSDLFLAIGFLFFVPFAAYSWKFMVTFDPSTLFLKNWMIIVLFTVSFICLGIYIGLEFKKGNITNKWFFWIFIFFAIMSVVTVLVQPNHSVVEVVCREGTPITTQYYPGTNIGDVVEVHQDITFTHKLFFSTASLLITTIFYIVLFIFPKRQRSFDFFIFATYMVAGFTLVLIIYSYIVEWSEYPPFFKALLEGDTDYIVYEHRICSFIVQRVPYGACLMMGILFFLLAHHLTNQKRWIFLIVFAYLNLLISWCKTSILITTLLLLAYAVYLLVVSYKDHKKRNLIILIFVGSVFFIGTVLSLISIVTKGSFLPKIYGLFSTIVGFKTVKHRTYIWDNIRQQLSGGWLIIGRGFGTHNLMLYPMNLVNGDDVCPSHSTYYAILGAGGLISFFGFVGLFAYYAFTCIKCWKVDKKRTLVLASPSFAYFLYSFTEGINYLWVTLMFPLILYYHLIKKEELK